MRRFKACIENSSFFVKIHCLSNALHSILLREALDRLCVRLNMYLVNFTILVTRTFRNNVQIMLMAPQPPSAKNGTLQSDVGIPGERDRRYGPPPPKRSDDDDDDE